MQNCVNSAYPDLVVLKGGGSGVLPQNFFLKKSVQNPAILDTSYELIGLHIEVHSGGTIRGVSECIKICIIS